MQNIFIISRMKEPITESQYSHRPQRQKRIDMKIGNKFRQIILCVMNCIQQSVGYINITV